MAWRVLAVGLLALQLGTYTAGQPIILPAGCSPLARLANGRVSYARDNAFGLLVTQASVECNSGYAPRGGTTSLCFGPRGWSPRIRPECVRSGSTGGGRQPGRIVQLPLRDQVTVVNSRCLRFACTVTGSPQLQIRWLVNGRRVNLRASSDLSQLPDGSMQACNVQAASHSGTYRCEVENEFGSAFRQVPLSPNSRVWQELAQHTNQLPNDVSVNPARGNTRPNPRPADGRTPSIEDIPVRESIRRVSSRCVQIACTVSGTPRPTVVWTLNGREIRIQRSSGGVFALRSGGSLTVCNGRAPQHTGHYRCTAVNDFGRAYKEIELRASDLEFGSNNQVQEPREQPYPPPRQSPPTSPPDREVPRAPSRRPRPPNNAGVPPFRNVLVPLDVSRWIEAVSSGCIVLVCTGDRAARPEISWSVEGRSLPGIRDYRTMSDGSLEICNANPRSHSASYKCIAKSAAGYVSTRIFIISQQHPIWSDLAARSQNRIVSNPQGEGRAPTIDYLRLADWVSADASHCLLLRCRVTGDPNPTVTWTFMDRPVAGSDYSVLRDGSLRACRVRSSRHSGRYRCDATNIYGSAWREVAVSQIHPIWEEIEEGYVRPQGPPADARDPARPTDILQQQTQRPPPQRGDSTPLPPATDSNNNNDAGLPPRAPVIEFIADLRDWVKLLENGCMKVFCSVSGSPKPNILWRKDSVRIAFNTHLFRNYHMLSDGSLRVCNQAAAQHAGKYRCDVSNVHGSAFRSLAIGNDHPVFGGTGAGEFGGDEPATDSPPPSPATTDRVPDVVPVETDSPEDTTTTTTIPNIPAQAPVLIAGDGAPEYVVRARNGCIKLLCDVIGFPEPDVSWTRDGRIVDPLDSDFNQYGDGLQVCDFDAAVHGGNYRCVAENRYGRTERNFTLREDAPSTEEPVAMTTATAQPHPAAPTGGDILAPSIAANDDWEFVTEDNCLQLACVATGTPIPLISWTLDSEIVGFDDGNDFEILEGGSLRICNIAPATKDRYVGRYVCSAANNHGSATRTFRVEDNDEVLVEILSRRGSDTATDAPAPPTPPPAEPTTQASVAETTVVMTTIAETTEVTTTTPATTTPAEVTHNFFPTEPTTVTGITTISEVMTEPRVTTPVEVTTEPEAPSTAVVPTTPAGPSGTDNDIVTVETADSDRQQCIRIMEENIALRLQLDTAQVTAVEAENRAKAMLARYTEAAAQRENARLQRARAERERGEMQRRLQTERLASTATATRMQRELKKCEDQRKRVMDIFNNARRRR